MGVFKISGTAKLGQNRSWVKTEVEPKPKLGLDRSGAQTEVGPTTEVGPKTEVAKRTEVDQKLDKSLDLRNVMK